MFSKSLKRGFIAAFMAFALASTAAAQQTSSEARGNVTSDTGSPIANARVVITHEPTGSRNTVESGDNGRYFRGGLRIGGPYTITVSADGYRDARYDNIFLSAGSQSPINITLSAVGDEVEELVVTASADGILDLANGVGSNFNSSDIINQPAATRDVLNTLERDPLANSLGGSSLSIAGVNPRFNGLAIDGSLQQNDFGLSSGTYATDRSPINLDAIESASVVAADYDVSAAGFTGGLVNLTIKSGTNEFEGTAYYDMLDDSWIGSSYDGGEFNSPPVDDREFGFTLGGPIIKDKLFFFVSYDEFEATEIQDFTSADSRNGIQPGFFDELRNLIIAGTGYDPGTRPSTGNTPATSERILTKFDWNVTDQHRLSFTYQDTQEQSTSVSGGGTEFQSAWYDTPIDLKAYTLQAFSDWSETLSTTVRFNYKEFSRGQQCRAGVGTVGEVTVDVDPDEVAGTPLEGLLTGRRVSTESGCDGFRQANDFSDDRLQFFAKADYFRGDHVITGGIEYEQYNLFNLFVPFSDGEFRYFDLDDLAAGTANITYRNVPSNNAREGAAEWGYDRWTLFLQDSWQITGNFELTYGLRYETFSQSDRPAFSQPIQDLYGVNTSENLDGRDLILPRVSFRWDIDDRSSLRGGFGQFSGGDPKVWTSNAFQVPIVALPRTEFENYTPPGPFEVPAELINQVSQGTPVPIDYISSDFEIPSDWKASLRYEREFFDGYNFTAQYLYTATENGFLWRLVPQLQSPTAQPTGVAPDGRIIYADLLDQQDTGVFTTNNLTTLTNHSEGESHVFSIALGKVYRNGFSFNASYAFQDNEIVSEGTSSRGISNFRAQSDINRNFPSPRTSPFQIEHAFKLNLAYERDFFGTGRSATRFDLFARRLSGLPFFNAFDLPRNGSNALFGQPGDGEEQGGNNPIYVPARGGDPRVVYASGFDTEGFLNYVGAGSEGFIEEPYSRTSAWNTLVDFRVQQQIPLFGEKANAKIWFSVENFLNLLNDDWGVFRSRPGSANAMLEADIVRASDVAALGVDGAPALLGDSPRTACFTAGSCVYRYNDFEPVEVSEVEPDLSVYTIRLGIRFEF